MSEATELIKEFRSDIKELQEKHKERIEDLDEEIDDLDEDIRSNESNVRELEEKVMDELKEIDKRALENQRPPVPENREEASEEIRKTFGKQLAAMAGKADPLDSEEREKLYKDIEKESLETRSLVEDSTGENLVPKQIADEIIRTVKEQAVVRGLVSSMTTESNRTQFKKITGSVTYEFGQSLEEGGSLTESTPTPDEDTLYIEDAYGFAKVGENELMDAFVDVARIIEEEFAAEKATVDDTKFVKGSGHGSNEPEGLTQISSDYQFDVASSGSLSFDDVIKLSYGKDPSGSSDQRLKDPYRQNGVFLLHPFTELTLLLKQATDEGYIWQPSMQAGVPNTIRGLPVYTTTALNEVDGTADNPLILFGDFRRGYRVIERMDMTVKQLDELYAESGMVGFRFKSRLTGGIIKEEAYRLLNNTSS